MNIEKYLIKKVSYCIKKHIDLDKNESILFAISGGKDSKSLLKILSKIHCKEKIIPIHIFPYEDDSLLDDIKNFCEMTLGRANSLLLIKNQLWEKNQSDCYICARARRKSIFETASKLNIKKIVYAHNKNDVAETFLMNVVFSGNNFTMMPNQPFFDNKFEVIRPFYYVTIDNIIRYCNIYNINPISYECVGKKYNKREIIREFLKNNDIKNEHENNSIVHKVFVSAMKSNLEFIKEN